MTTPNARRYAIIAPCRNEANFMRKTLDSILLQSIAPALLLVVDDGSTDDTPKILDEYKPKMPYLRVVTRADRGTRAVGGGVIEAFYAGFDTITIDDYDYICKLDLDLILPPAYFENLMKRLEANPRLGTCSGKPYFPHPDTGVLTSEGCGDETSIGASKFYKVACFKDIGGFVRQVMWDGIDCHTCRMKGWIARSWDDEDIRFIHLRPMGSSQQNIWVGRKRHGFGQWFMGASLIYTTAAAINRIPKHPRVIGALAMWWGYIESMLQRKPRYDAPGFRKFVRKWQWEALVLGKRRATQRAEARGQALSGNPR